MANEQNLKTPSTSEARERGSKGGINSGKARRRKADLRKMAQEVLDGTFTDKHGREFTGSEAVIQGLIANLADPKGKNWGKAMDLLVELLGADKSREQIQMVKSQIALNKAKTDDIKMREKEFKLKERELQLKEDMAKNKSDDSQDILSKLDDVLGEIKSGF